MLLDRRQHHQSLRRRSPSGREVVWALPLASVIFYVLALVATLATLLTAIYAYADVAIAPYLTQAWLKAPSGSVMLMGHAPFFAGFWILRALHGFGAYRETWELTPWVLSAIASLIVGRAVALVAGRAAGLLVSAVLICAGGVLLQLQLAWSIHGLAYVDVMLIGAFATRLAADQARTDPLALGLITAVLTLTSAAGIATDKLVLVAGLVPFVLTCAVALRHGEPERMRATGVAALGLVCGSVLGAVLIHAAMQSEGIRATPFPLDVSPVGDVPSHLKLLAQGVFSLLNGYIHQPDSFPTGVLGYACAVAVLCLITLAATETVRSLRRPLSRVKAPRHGRPSSVADARATQAIYWGSSAALLTAAYLFTTVGVDIHTRRYLVTVAYAVVILGIAGGTNLSRAWRVTTIGAVTLIVGTGAVGLFQHGLQKTEPAAPTAAMATAVKHLAVREHVPVVYAGYWDAYPLGWLTADARPIYPVTSCGAGLCAWTRVPGAGTGISSWYLARHHVRSLLVLDRELDAIDLLPRRPPRSLGAPIARFSLDRGRLDAYLYSYDIAARFGGATATAA